jgi:hypothetical protein
MESRLSTVVGSVSQNRVDFAIAIDRIGAVTSTLQLRWPPPLSGLAAFEQRVFAK